LLRSVQSRYGEAFHKPILGQSPKTCRYKIFLFLYPQRSKAVGDFQLLNSERNASDLDFTAFLQFPPFGDFKPHKSTASKV
jgi:hypothetical protein